MSGKNLEQLLIALAERLVKVAAADPEVRSLLKGLAELALSAPAVAEPAAGEVEAAPAAAELIPSAEEASLAAAVEQAFDALEKELSTATSAAEPTPTPTPSPRPTPTPTPEPPREPLPELTLGRSSPTPPEPVVVNVRQRRSEQADLSLLERRCRLKAEGARWAAARRRLLADGVDFDLEIDPRDRDIIARARETPNCYLWMNHPSGPSPSNLALYEMVAGCFEAVADALALVDQIEDQPEALQAELEAALDLLAEAQSALRVAIIEIDGPVDGDQTAVFRWLQAIASERQIYIRRHMRLDDPGDPAAWPDIQARIEACDARLQESQQRGKKRKKLLGKVRHKASLIAEDPTSSDEQWRLLAAVVDELVDDGLPPSNRELRELLISIVEQLPEMSDLPRGFELVLREIDRYLATIPAPESPTPAAPSAEVVEAASLLRGRSLVLIGGDKRPGAHQSLKNAFGLRDLIWIETREHQSIEGFEPYVARSDVAAVVLAIRWSSHSFGDVRDFCEKHGKPLVRLPGGYNQNQVAAQIMAQCSERIRTD